MKITRSGPVGTILIDRPPVNALTPDVLAQLNAAFSELSADGAVKTVVLTGRGGFFSFGFDVPGMMDFEKSEFHSFVTSFSRLIRSVFLYGKPVVAAIGGHCVAGGAVLALSCDYRIMLDGKAKISLNELTFGSTIFSSIAEVLVYAVGSKNAEHIIYSGTMYSARRALELNLVDEAVTAADFENAVSGRASQFAAKDTRAFGSIKNLLKNRTRMLIESGEEESISEFVEFWYSEETRKKLAQIEIRS